MSNILYDLLDHILPSSDRSKPHDIFRLEYLSACKIMENENNIIKILPQIPDVMFVPLLQSVIYKCYLDFIDIDNISSRYSIENIQCFLIYLEERRVAFPETLWILILNWPHTELILRNVIPSLHPPVNIFLDKYGPLAKQKLSNCQEEDMTMVFEYFFNKLIKFITKAVFRCTPRNTFGFSCNLRKLDVSHYMLSLYNSPESFKCFSRPEDILGGIRNSTIHTFGHKIEIFADAVISSDCVGSNRGLDLLSNIVVENLKANTGISVYFKKVFAEYNNVPIPSDFYNVLALGKCDYIELSSFVIDITLFENLCTHLPELVGLSLPDPFNIGSLDFLRNLEYLEHFSLHNKSDNLVDSISNMSKGLKFLELYECPLTNQDLECLANSIHSNTLLELTLSSISLKNESEAVGLITLCQKLKNVKVLTLHDCSLDTLSSHSVSLLVKAFKDCAQLEYLALYASRPRLSLEITTIIIEGLAEKLSLRYLCLDLQREDDDDEDEPKLCKSFHETINRFRNSPLYISWYYL